MRYVRRWTYLQQRQKGYRSKYRLNKQSKKKKYICNHCKHKIKLNFLGHWISHIMQICAECFGTFQGLIQASMFNRGCFIEFFL